jgi:toxin ParE1/3/4
MEIIWREVALNGLEHARDFIAANNPTAANRIFDAILSSVKRLAERPNSGRPGRVEGTRECVVTGTPYVVAYAVVDGRLNVIAILHGAQEWPEQF